MSEKIITLNEDAVKTELKDLVRKSVEETLNELLDSGKRIMKAGGVFLVWLKSRGLDGVKLVVGDKNLGMCESIHEVFPEAKYQRCTVYFYRNIMSSVPRNRLREVTMMLKAIYAQESKEAARKKAREVAEKLKEMRLNVATKKLEDGIEETLTYMDFPSQHWLKIHTNNVKG